MRLKRQPFHKFDTSTNVSLWNSKDVRMLFICILSVSITTYSFRELLSCYHFFFYIWLIIIYTDTVLFYYYFKKDLVPIDYIPVHIYLQF